MVICKDGIDCTKELCRHKEEHEKGMDCKDCIELDPNSPLGHPCCFKED